MNTTIRKIGNSEGGSRLRMHPDALGGSLFPAQDEVHRFPIRQAGYGDVVSIQPIDDGRSVLVTNGGGELYACLFHAVRPISWILAVRPAPGLKLSWAHPPRLIDRMPATAAPPA